MTKPGNESGEEKAVSSAETGRKLISIIIPAYNEESNIQRVYSEVTAVLDPLPYDFEFIVIDNASTDRTPDLARAICARDQRWKFIRFSRNFTVEMSITAGYRHCIGDAAVVLYSDLQDPPEVIPTFLAKWEEGNDIVYGVRTQRPGDPKWRNAAVGVAYKTISWMADNPIPENAGDFRLLSRRAIFALESCPEHNRYLRGLIAWLGFPQTGVEYERKPRIGGRTSTDLAQLLYFTLGAITGFSLKPLRLFTLFGCAITTLSMILVPYYLIGWMFGQAPAGITTVILLLLLLLGINSLGIGVLGEYLGRTYAEVKRRPLYIIDEAINISPKASQ